MSLFSSFFIALLVSMVLVPPLMRVSGRLHLIDEPGDRKMHADTIPRSGGLAIIIGALIPILIWWPDDRVIRGMLLGGSIIAVFGLIDDRSGLDYRWKFFGQILAAIVAISAGAHIEILPFFGIDPGPVWLTYPLTFIFLVGVTNAINLSDGLDGLAAGTSLITLGVIAWLFYSSGATANALICLAVIGGVCGFLRYNNHPAVVFMGDSGSQFLGYFTGVLAIVLTQQTNTALNPALLVLLLGVPILDTLAVMTWRMRRGRSPFEPDKNHFHHRLLEFGFHHYEAVSVIYIAQALLVSVAIAVRFQSDPMVVGVYVVFSLIVVGLFRLAKTKRFRIRSSEVAAGSERRNLWLRRMPWLPQATVTATTTLAAMFLFVSAFYPAAVGRELGVAAAVVGALLAVGFVMPGRVKSVVTRFLIYLAGVCAVYAMIGPARFEWLEAWHINALMMALAIALVLAIRMTRRDQFRTTPLDLLIMFFVVVVVVATNLRGAESGAGLADTAIRLAVFFYAGEFLQSRTGGNMRALPAVAIAAMAVLAGRAVLA